MNEHDSERIAGLLEADGLLAATSEDAADVLVLNTCCIRENADNKLYGNLGHLKGVKDERPDFQIAVAGCLAQKDRELIRQRAPHVDVVLGTHNVGRVTDLLEHARQYGPITEIAEESEEFPSALPVRRDASYAAWVTIQIGCDNSCAFCIVPAVRGPEISRPLAELIEEVHQLAAEGTTEVTLLGQNVNSYGRDLTLAERRAKGKGRVRPLFAELLRDIGKVDGIQRVRFTSPHPKDLRPETIAAMAETPAVCEHLHLPLQAGSDEVLSAMHRGYTAERYLERLASARAVVDDLAVTTDIIVAFPSETEADFVQTLEVAAEVQYDSAYTFLFSPRPGTEAAEATDQFVPADIAHARFERLLTVIEHSAAQKHAARVGRQEEIVVEGVNKRDERLLSGRTRQNKVVHFAADTRLRDGTYGLVEITDAGKHHLRGELVAVTAEPRHRTRIPVAAV